MALRNPAPAQLANSDARFALLMRTETGMRSFELGRGVSLAILILSALLALWFAVSATYLFARDELAGGLFAGERRVIQAYEDRIAELRARIDRISAHQVMNQDTIEDRVAGLVARQAELEARQVIVAELDQRAARAGVPQAAPAEPATTAALPPQARPASALSFAPAQARKPQPLEPIAPLNAAPLNAAPLQSAPQQPAPAIAPAPAAMRGPLEGVVGEIERRSGRMEQSQLERLKVIGDTASLEIEKSRKLVASLGLDPARFGRVGAPQAPIRRPAPLDELTLRDVSSEGTALGGPLLPVQNPASLAERFEAELARAEWAVEAAGKGRLIQRALPLGRPLAERHELSSGFGTRLDPFTRGLALHSGLDFKAPPGTPVRAVAPGRVIEAGYNGGYGRMVEIDHGHGITTRYAHLSAIAVTEGDRIEKGGIIGQVGSTGRSTGPHLHYEVRIDDDATDPMRFVRAEASRER